MRLDTYQDAGEKKRWKIVRTTDYADVEGEIIAADEATGECTIKVGEETKSHSFGSGGIRIVGRRR